MPYADWLKIISL